MSKQEFNDHSDGYGGEHFMRLIGIEPGNSFPQDRCSKLQHFCKICNKKIDHVKAHEHKCLKDLLIKSQAKFMVNKFTS
jgi:hypothetical protein